MRWRDGDTIHAVIRGSAVNNDGAAKVGYTAPSVDGQADVIARRSRVADVDPAIDRLCRGPRHRHGARRSGGNRGAHPGVSRRDGPSDSARIGSLKSNIGHLDAAAGVAGLIKTVLALHTGSIPPSLHFERPNPRDRLGHHARSSSIRGRRVGRRRPAPRRRQLVRDRRDQCARRARGGAPQ